MRGGTAREMLRERCDRSAEASGFEEPGETPCGWWWSRELAREVLSTMELCFLRRWLWQLGRGRMDGSRVGG